MLEIVRKYEALWKLRQPGAEYSRSALRAVSAEFPGALRELDVLSECQLRARLSHAQAVCAGSPAEAWLEWLLAYHCEMRLALTVQRHIGRERVRARGEPEQVLRRLAEQGVKCSSERLRSLLNPPSGKLNQVVFSWVAARFGVSTEEVESTLFPRPQHRAEPA